MTGPLAHLAMYDLVEVRDAAEALWRAIAARLGPDAPGALSWPAAIEAACREPGLVLGQTCGLPLVTALDGAVRVVGAFTYGDGASDVFAKHRLPGVPQSFFVEHLSDDCGPAADFLVTDDDASVLQVAGA